MSRIACGCESKSDVFATCFARWQMCNATKQGFVLVPRRAREVIVLARPVDEENGAILAFLADGESWSSSSSGDCARHQPAYSAESAWTRSRQQEKCSRSAARGLAVG